MQHYHSKVVKDRKIRLAPTLRNVPVTETTQIYDGMVSKPANDYPQRMSENAGPSSQFLSEYQSRMLGAKADFQFKKMTGKKLITPSFTRHKQEQLQGVGLLVTAQRNFN